MTQREKLARAKTSLMGLADEKRRVNGKRIQKPTCGDAVKSSLIQDIKIKSLLPFLSEPRID
jgi:hypothetical protein